MAQAKYIIKAEDQTQKGRRSALRGLGELEQGFSTASQTGVRGFTSIGKTLLSPKVGIIAGVALLTKKMTDFGRQSRRVWLQNEQTVRRYQAAIQSSNADLSEMNDFIRQISRQSTTAATDIQGMAARLMNLGRTDTETQQILEAGVGIANATGKQLDTVVRQLNQSFSGTASTLQRELLPGVQSLTREQLANGDAIKMALDKYGEFNDIMEGTSQQTLKNFNDAMGDLHEATGQFISNGLDPLIRWMTNAASFIASQVQEVNTTRESRLQRDEFLSLFGAGNQLVTTGSGRQQTTTFEGYDPQAIGEAMRNANIDELAMMQYALQDLISQTQEANTRLIGEERAANERLLQTLNHQLGQLNHYQDTLPDRMAERERRQQSRADSSFLQMMRELRDYEQSRNQIIQEAVSAGASDAEKFRALFQAGMADGMEIDQDDLNRLWGMIQDGRSDLMPLFTELTELMHWQATAAEKNTDDFAEFLQEMAALKRINQQQNRIQEEILAQGGSQNDVRRAWLEAGLGDSEVTLSGRDISRLMTSNNEMAERIGAYFIDILLREDSDQRPDDGSGMPDIAGGIQEFLGDGIIADMVGGWWSYSQRCGLSSLCTSGKRRSWPGSWMSWNR